MSGAPNPNSASIALNPDGTVALTFPENEMVARFLVDKLRSEMDRQFAMRAAVQQAQQQRNGIIPAKAMPKLFGGRN